MLGVSDDKRKAAARRLISLYRNELQESPPESLLLIASRSQRWPEAECRSSDLVVEVRGSSDGQLRIGGLAAVFGRYSRPLPGGFIERVESQAFSISSGNGWPDVVCALEHRDVLGSIRGKSLQLEVLPAGLDYTCALTPSRRDIWELCERGDLASSFKFMVAPDGDSWSHDPNSGMPVRSLHSVRLLDVSCVAVPAYESTSVAARSLAAFMDCPVSDVERYAEADEWRKFFVRTDRDNPGPRSRSWQQAHRERELELMAMVPGAQPTPLTAWQRRKMLTDMRYSPEPRRGRDALLETMRVRWGPGE